MQPAPFLGTSHVNLTLQPNYAAPCMALFTIRQSEAGESHGLPHRHSVPLPLGADRHGLLVRSPAVTCNLP